MGPAVIMVLTVLLVLLAVPLSSPVSVLDRKKLSPCKFNPLCLCTSNGDNLGAVECSDVELANIPQELMDSRVFALTLAGNSLRILQEDSLRNMGCWSVEISRNELTKLPQAAFSGLERSVWRLILAGNEFTEIPYSSLQRLSKLDHLDLSDNAIATLDEAKVSSLSPSLKTIVLAGNCISSVPEGIFVNLPELELLDLSRNMIINIHSMALTNGLPALAHLYLADNLLPAIPFTALHNVKALKTLDISLNRIVEIDDSFSDAALRLDQLILDDNNINIIRQHSFKNFKWLNFTSLQGNPLHTIENDAFSDSEIRHLDLSNCQIGNILPGAFRGLERSLQELNLASNRLTVLPINVLEDFDSIKKIDLSNNVLAISPNYTFSDFRFSVLDLDLSGDHMRYITSREIGLLRNLRRLSLPELHNYGTLRLNQFDEFPPGLEDITLVNCDIKIIRNNAFYHIPSINYLDLSGNNIQRIEENAFKEIGNSLRTLRMRHALHLTDLPNLPFQDLVALTTLDLSDNHIVNFPLDTLYKMNNLRELYLQDNEIERFQLGTLHSQANPHLQVLDLSFNHLRRLESDMFRFEKLEVLLINDNRVQTITSRSFVGMTSLKHLSLEGNEIAELADESFQNLHNLQTLSLAHNKIRSLNFESFDYIGSLSSLRIDVSHNNIGSLSSNKSNRYATNSGIRSLDLSFNNISLLQPGYFETVSSVLKTIDLSHNNINTITKDTIGCLRKLVVLDLSYNRIHTIAGDTFMDMKLLQRLNLANNNINTLNQHSFSAQKGLQWIDMSHNELNSLPENIFPQGNMLETLKLSFNNLDEIPVKALNPVQSSLRHLDLKHNNISIISESQLNQIRHLVVLDLSHNNINDIDQRAFCCLPSLVSLSLAHNPIQVLSENLLEGVSSHLEDLDLANTSLTLLPTLNLPQLIRLNMSMNKLTFVPSSSLGSMTKIRWLDLSLNSMPSPPHNVWFILPDLAYLSLRNNPISNLKNDSFLSLDRLEKLDLGGLDLLSVEIGAFIPLPSLRHLALSVSAGRLENLGGLLSLNPGLTHLELLTNDADLKQHLATSLPDKLKEISIVSDSITKLHPAAFKSVVSRRLRLNLISSNVVLERDLFLNLGYTQNLTIDISGPVGSRSVGSVVLSNPASTYSLGAPHSVFLEGIHLGEKIFPCNCDSMGWLGKWLRRWRGEMCNNHLDPQALLHCQQSVRSLRGAGCQHYGGHLLDTLKQLDCLSYNASPALPSSSFFTVLVLFMLALR